MTDDVLKALEQEKARLRAEAAAKEAAAAAIEREIAERHELARLAIKYGMSVSPVAVVGSSAPSQTTEASKPNSAFDGTLAGLLAAYRADEDSPYRRLRFKSRESYDTIMDLIIRDYGERKLGDLSGRDFVHWHRQWAEGGKTSISHAKIGMLRILFGFGASILKDETCASLSGMLKNMRFQMAKPRKERLTAEHATAIRKMAHKMKRHSIALAQAFQFDAKLNQKDCIGEWVPISEPGMSSNVIKGDMKWLHGLRWEEIDENFVLRHTTSRRRELVEVDLRGGPMVMEELRLIRGFNGHRSSLPESGPIIIYEKTKQPWSANEFRRYWRQVATAADVPKNVRNMDTRAGAKHLSSLATATEVDETFWGAEADASTPRH